MNFLAQVVNGISFHFMSKINLFVDYSITLYKHILAKAGHLQTLEQLIANAEAFETTLQHQLTLSGTTDPSSISRISDYCKQHQNKPT